MNSLIPIRSPFVGILKNPTRKVKAFLSKLFLLNMACIFVCSSCAWVAPIKGQLGYSDGRRVVIVGENVDQEIAMYYQSKYDALVWFTKSKGKITHAWKNLKESGFGPSRPMRALIEELKSINLTLGRWEIIIPKIAEKYFLLTLKNMPTGSLSRARGEIVLIDSNHSPEMEKEVLRVCGKNFYVSYEFHQVE